MKEKIFLSYRVVKIILVILILILGYILYSIFKTDSIEDLKELALFHLNEYELYGERGLETYNFKGPRISKNSIETITFQWYSILEWGDSASIYVEVYKKGLKRHFYAKTISMNYQENYVAGPYYKITDLIPKSYTSNPNIINKLDSNSIVVSKGITLIKPKEILIKLIKSGYVYYFDRRDIVTYIRFIEPIAKYNSWNEPSIFDGEMTIKNDSTIKILIYEFSDSFWDKYDGFFDPIGLSKGKYIKK